MTLDSLRYIEGDTTSCQGNDSHDSHPRIFLDLSSGEVVACPYCGAKFKKMNDSNSEELVLLMVLDIYSEPITHCLQ